MHHHPPLEQGHFIPNPFFELFSDSLLTGMTICGVGCVAVGLPRPEVVVLPSLAFASSEGCKELLDEMRYEQEEAREIWEHKMSPFMEVQEFVDYAINKGVSEDEAIELGRRFVQHPQLSVPFHLEIEIGIHKSLMHGQTAKKALVRVAGLLTGALGSALAVSCCEKLGYSNTATTVALTSLLLGSAFALKQGPSRSIERSSKVYLASGVYFATLLSLSAIIKSS